MSLRHRRRAAALGVTTALVVVATALSSPLPSLAAASSGDDDSGGSGPPWKVVATGLDNPRHLDISWTSGRHHRGHRGARSSAALYVAEAGRGGTGDCLANPEDPTASVCFGLSGAVTRVRHGHQSRVVEGLPSLASADGSGALGPADVAVHRDWYAVSIGLGADPAARDTIKGGEKLGTLLGGRFYGRQRVIADLAAYEAVNDPDGAGPDSNPTGIKSTRHGIVLTDSGANALQAVSRSGDITTVATFAERLVPAPPFLPPGDIPMQAVPTSVVRGPDGAWYVSQLTGFPFPPDAANIYRVVPGEEPTVYASGLTNVTDLAWHKGKLYAVQIAGDAGLLAAGEELPMGSLERINHDGTSTTVAGDLPAPYGVAMAGGNAYVTTCSVCAGAGEVVRISLG
jgi:hypothetical protein